MEKFNPTPNCTDISEYGSLRAEDALDQLLACMAPVNGGEWVPLHAAIDRVLADKIVSATDVPAHANSAVDGYAVNSADFPQNQINPEFKVIDTALAGQPARSVVKALTAIRIMTGAVLPQGADTVLMQEHVEIKPQSIKLYSKPRPGENIRPAGEDMKTGETVLGKGQLCNPADIGLIASLGRGEVRVKHRARVGIFSTGTEIKHVSTPLGPGECYDSNRYTLYAALQRLPIDVTDYGIIPDNKKLLEETMATAQKDNNVVITTGGVSVGEADYTREILQNMGKILFSKVAIKPGRPLTFATVRSTPFFALPGNPVAVMVTYYQFVLPALKKLMGLIPSRQLLTIKARVMNRIRKKPGRTEYQRGILSQTEPGLWTVHSTGLQGSGILRSMSLANAFIILPHEASTIEPGEEIIVQPFEAFR